MNDIITMTLHGWRYHLPTGASFLELPKIQLASNYAHILRREQAYLSNDGGKVLEIIGIDDTTLTVRTWRINEHNNMTVSLNNKQDSFDEMTWNEVFPKRQLADTSYPKTTTQTGTYNDV